MNLDIDIACKPIPKARPRVVKGRAYTEKRTVEYEKLISDHAFVQAKKARWKVTEEPLFIAISFFNPNPNADIDNLIKAVLDGLKKAKCVFKDDKQFKEIKARIWDNEPEDGICISVWLLSDWDKERQHNHSFWRNSNA